MKLEQLMEGKLNKGIELGIEQGIEQGEDSMNMRSR